MTVSRAWILAVVGIAVSILPAAAFASEAAVHAGAPHFDAAELSVFWVLPFAGMLLSIAVFPLIAPHFWHHHFGKIALFWALSFLGPFAVFYGPALTLYELVHVSVADYIPFIILIGALYTVSGGVRVTGSLVGTPGVNASFLALGTFLASLMGTTGAAMLLIRPLLKANEKRCHKVHTVVFFIFLVANIGGSLTPLGDPPLFLGFLHGVDFFWTTTHLLAPMLLISVALLAIYFAIECYWFKREPPAVVKQPEESLESASEKLGIEGKINLLLLLGIVVSVLLAGVWHPGTAFSVFHVPVAGQNLASALLQIGIAVLSLKLTSRESRRRNAFTWFPIVEVAKLFAGIFVTIIPAIAILKAGSAGALGLIVDAVNHHGQPLNHMYFWATGMLSSFLDNAPTYLIFFNTAGGDADRLMTELGTTLLAISAGAVFMGANTYIGNAPNFMVKSIAEERGVKMPSFFGYMAWSGTILLPLFGVLTLIFFL
ncbi:MAG: sodium:proton antiporter [Azospirillum sp.]|nr:sodium:proton antiporter [Azospirillum sp.]